MAYDEQNSEDMVSLISLKNEVSNESNLLSVMCSHAVEKDSVYFYGPCAEA